MAESKLYTSLCECISHKLQEHKPKKTFVHVLVKDIDPVNPKFAVFVAVTHLEDNKNNCLSNVAMKLCDVLPEDKQDLASALNKLYKQTPVLLNYKQSPSPGKYSTTKITNSATQLFTFRFGILDEAKEQDYNKLVTDLDQLIVTWTLEFKKNRELKKQHEDAVEKMGELWYSRVMLRYDYQSVLASGNTINGAISNMRNQFNSALDAFKAAYLEQTAAMRARKQSEKTVKVQSMQIGKIQSDINKLFG
jgi:hypothetical protein